MTGFLRPLRLWLAGISPQGHKLDSRLQMSGVTDFSIIPTAYSVHSVGELRGYILGRHGDTWISDKNTGLANGSDLRFFPIVVAISISRQSWRVAFLATGRYPA